MVYLNIIIFLIRIMEAQKPIVMDTPQIDKEIKDIKFSSEFSIKLNNDNYLIMIGILKE